MNSRSFRPMTIGAIVFAGLLGLVFAVYAFQIFSVSRRVTDWILIGPVAFIGITALIFAAVTDLRKGRLKPGEVVEKQTAQAALEDRTALTLVILVVCYALTMPWLGFDVGTALFVALALFVQGERRWWLMGTISITSATLLVLVFKYVLWVRMPTMLL